MSDDDLREEVEQLRGEVEGLERRFDSIEAALERYLDETVEPSSPEESEHGADQPDPSGDGPAGPVGAPEADRSGSREATPREGESSGWTRSDLTEPVEETGSSAAAGGASESVESPAGGASESVESPAGGTSETDDDGTEPHGEKAGGRNLELDLGGRWLGIVGAITLVLGIVFLTNVAIDRGWIGPLAQLALGLVTGVGLAVGGRYAATRRGYERWGMVLVGAGIGLTYVVGYTAYAFESYQAATGLSLTGAVLALSAVVAAAVVLSVRDDTRIVAGESFLLGYLTIWIGRDLGEVVLVAAVVLGAGIAATVAIRQWRWLPFGGVIGSYTLYWTAVTDDPTWLVEAVPLAALLAVFGAAAILAMRDRTGPIAGVIAPAGDGSAVDPDERSATGSSAESSHSTLDRIGRGLPPATMVLNVLIFTPSAFFVLGELAPSLQPLLFVGLAALLVGYDALAQRVARRRDPTAPYLAVVVLVFAAPAAFDGVGTTLALAAIALVVGTLAAVADDRPYRYGAYGIAALVSMKVLLVDSWAAGSFVRSDPASLSALHAGVGAAIVLGLLAVGYWRLFDRLRAAVGGASGVDSPGAGAGTAGSESAGSKRFGAPADVGEISPDAKLTARLRHTVASTRPRVWHTWLGMLVLAVGIAAGAGGSGWWSVTGAGLLVALLGLGLRADSMPVQYSADVVTLLVLVRILTVDLSELPSFDFGSPLAANRTVVAVAGILACYGAFLLLDEQDRWLGRQYSQLLSVRLWYLRAGTLLVVAGLLAELSGFPASAAWAVVGFLLLGLGVATGLQELRYQSLAVLLLTTAKVFLVDTSGLDSLARALSFIVLAVFLLAASYLYARYGDRIAGAGSDPAGGEPAEGPEPPQS